MIKLSPRLNNGTFVFCNYDSYIIDDIESIATFKEQESISHVIRKSDADKLGIFYNEEWAWITLDYQSDLSMTGITSAFSTALSQAEIPCNVIAAFYHDHLFVPKMKAIETVEILRKLEI